MPVAHQKTDFSRLTDNLKPVIKSCYLLFLFLLVISCKKDKPEPEWKISSYSGSYVNINFTESFIRDFSPGIYEENDIPDEVKQLGFGRIEIDFSYNGGGELSFKPLFYYGSINRNDTDDYFEETRYNLVVEIGHYNVIPFPVDYLFYTICTERWPRYCRDTYSPLVIGKRYTFVIDKRPEGMILQLKDGKNIDNIFPHAYFPDSSQMFFKDVTSYIEANKGDSLRKVLMVGKGFVAFEKGLHDFNGIVSNVRIYKYSIPGEDPRYELKNAMNQHTENQQVKFITGDRYYESNETLQITYEFWPYQFASGVLTPSGDMQRGTPKKIENNKIITHNITNGEIGFYKVYLKTLDASSNVIDSTSKPFDIWIYPKEWEFEFYK
jgi:hypothetical protein